MPRGPQGQRRPADVIRCAVTVAKIATGELQETMAQSLGKIRSGKVGGPARANKLSSDSRKKIAKEGASARWNQS
jgi:hypothetical protein